MKRRQEFIKSNGFCRELSGFSHRVKSASLFRLQSPSTRGYAKRSYTDGEFILTSICFGKQLSEDDLKEIKAVVKARIAAFDRDDAEMGYMTLFE